MNANDILDFALGKSPSAAEPLEPVFEGKDRLVNGALEFSGTRDPNFLIQQEKARHRLAAYLYTTGMTQSEVAKRLGVTDATVSNWVRQPFFQKFVREEMALSGRDRIKEILQGEATASVFTLIELRDTPTTPATVRRQCCTDILDRVYGKAPQTVHSIHHEGGLDSAAQVQNELTRLVSDRALMQSLNPSQS